jgi:beta-fructofuranosidase
MMNTKMSLLNLKAQKPMSVRKVFIALWAFFNLSFMILQAQPPKIMTVENISRTIEETWKNAPYDSSRPGYHLIPHAGFMGDPNGGIYDNGWYHIFYLHNPFSNMPGPWYWGHARSRDLLTWEQIKPALLPAYDLGLNEIGSGSTILDESGKPVAFYSTIRDGSMKFWRAVGSSDLMDWHHEGPNPVMSLDQPGLPKFDVYWRDPFVFRAGGRTFLICCADLFDDVNVNVPIFEAKDAALTAWDYKGILFSYPKHKLRNLEVPELRPLGDKWLMLASCDAPVDRTYCFVGDFDIKNLKFTPSSESPLDYCGHFYAQETIPDDQGNLNLMAWIPGWDRNWMPNYQSKVLKNTAQWWNGCFAIPRRLTLDAFGNLIQQPVSSMKKLRMETFTMGRTELPVKNVIAAYDVLTGIRGNQLEINLELELGTASFCGMNVLCDKNGSGGMYIMWSGDQINVDGIGIPIREWSPGKPLQLQVFVDRVYIEVFINGGRYCVTRKVREENITGDYVALTRLGGRAVLNSLEAWKLKTINTK